MSKLKKGDEVIVGIPNDYLIPSNTRWFIASVEEIHDSYCIVKDEYGDLVVVDYIDLDKIVN